MLAKRCEGSVGTEKDLVDRWNKTAPQSKSPDIDEEIDIFQLGGPVKGDSGAPLVALDGSVAGVVGGGYREDPRNPLDDKVTTSFNFAAYFNKFLTVESTFQRMIN